MSSSTSSAWWEWLIVAGGTGIAVAGIVVWCGAWLAAALVGRSWPVPVTAGVSAVWRLPSHLTDPALAWPLPARGSLPGPVLYWLATVVPVAVLAGLVAAGWWVWTWG